MLEREAKRKQAFELAGRQMRRLVLAQFGQLRCAGIELGPQRLSDWITRCLKDVMDESVGRMQAGLAVLASIGSTAPFVGLFGTVWGIYHALLTIGATGQTLTIRQDSYDRASYMPGVVLACKRIAEHPGVTEGLDSYL